MDVATVQTEQVASRSPSNQSPLQSQFSPERHDRALAESRLGLKQNASGPIETRADGEESAISNYASAGIHALGALYFLGLSALRFVEGFATAGAIGAAAATTFGIIAYMRYKSATEGDNTQSAK